MTKTTRDVGASVKAQLLRLARSRGDDYQLLLLRYANERLLYRLAVSPYASRFVLKGAALFTLWTGLPHRATRDIDLHGIGDPSEAHVRKVMLEVISQAVDDDGVVFDAETLTVAPIREDQAYGGVRVALLARIASAQIRLQIDVGFGDAIRATFKRRGTAIPKERPVAFTSTFTGDTSKTMQWTAFVKKSGIDGTPDLGSTVAEVAAFLEEPLAVAISAEPFTKQWNATRGWN